MPLISGSLLLKQSLRTYLTVEGDTEASERTIFSALSVPGMYLFESAPSR